ncbi:hypothetical protein [Agaricicola taiwanensis]|nr:hypothetical protein [Agaricicola taiwanensis]
MTQKPTNKPEPSDRNFGAETTETDLANARMGSNRLEGNDQASVRNERPAMPEASTRTEGVIESFENMDPKTRAARERPSKG